MGAGGNERKEKGNGQEGEKKWGDRGIGGKNRRGKDTRAVHTGPRN